MSTPKAPAAPETPPQKPVDLDAHIQALVDAAPPLTPTQRARLAVLLSRRKPSVEGERV